MSQQDEARKLDRASAVLPERVKVWEDEFHVLHASLDGKDFSKVRAVHAFPVTAKADYVSFLDESNREVFLLAHPHRLDRQSRKALEQALTKMYYVAKITRIDSITEIMGVTSWQVETDRGYATFEVVDREHIRKLPGGRYLITDADGNRFEMEEITRLDARSQAIAQSEL
jgi:hypothetical protein